MSRQPLWCARCMPSSRAHERSQCSRSCLVLLHASSVSGLRCHHDARRPDSGCMEGLHVQVDLGESEMHHIFEFFDRVPTHMAGSPSSGSSPGHSPGSPPRPNRSHAGVSAQPA